MTIVKTCKIHGDLTLEECSPELNKSKKRYLYRCKKCRVLTSCASQKRRRAKVREKHKQFRQKNLEHCRRYMRDYRQKEREYLTDSHILDIITRRTTLRRGDIQPWMVDVKRAHLVLKKYIIELKE